MILDTGFGAWAIFANSPPVTILPRSCGVMETFTAVALPDVLFTVMTTVSWAPVFATDGSEANDATSETFFCTVILTDAMLPAAANPEFESVPVDEAVYMRGPLPAAR